MKLAKDIIQSLQNSGFEAHYAKETARNIYLNLPNTGKYIYIATSASLSKIREMCKKEGLSCRIHKKINKMTLELIVKNRYIIAPFVQTTLKNNYAVRKYTSSRKEAMESVGYTIDSFMYDPTTNTVDFVPGTYDDVASKLIRLVGKPHDKITENRMYMLEAGLLLASLGGDWQVEYETFEAIQQRALEIAIVSAESIRDSTSYLMREVDKPSLAFRFYKNSGILSEVMPWLLKGVGLPQSNKANNLDLFTHIMYALDSVGINKPNYEALRWACIFHDIAKPYTKSYDKKGNVHFYGHDKIGAIFATRWMEAHKFDRQLITKVSTLCKHHLFDASLRLDNDAITRLINRVGKDHILDLVNLREADRWGTGRKDISMKKVDVLREKIKKLLK